MTFDEWCKQRDIRGEWKNALFTTLLLEYGAEWMDTTGPDEWEATWKRLLLHALERLKKD